MPRLCRQLEKVCVRGRGGGGPKILPVFESLFFPEPDFWPGRGRAGPVDPTVVPPSTFPGSVGHSPQFSWAAGHWFGCT